MTATLESVNTEIYCNRQMMKTDYAKNTNLDLEFPTWVVPVSMVALLREFFVEYSAVSSVTMTFITHTKQRQRYRDEN